MIQPMISIVIPFYNLEKYAVKTLDSVFAQTYLNTEVIAVDDGSADGTGKILDEYARHEKRLKVIHKQNEGVSRARLDGIKAAGGEYIGFVDGDDLIDSDMYERLLANALKYDADISHCGYRMIRPDGKTEYYYNTGEVIIQDNRQGIYDLLDGSKIEPGLCNKLFHKSLFHSLLHNSKMDWSLKENEDLLMNYYLFKESAVSIYEDFCPYCYIVRIGSSSHGKVKEHILSDPIKIGETFLKETEEDNDLYKLSSRYYVTKLIKAITFNYDKNSDINKSLRIRSQKKLKSFLRQYLKVEAGNSLKMCRAVLACYFPRLYVFLHKLYLSGR